MGAVEDYQRYAARCLQEARAAPDSGIGLSWSKWLKLGASSPNTRPPPTFVNQTLWNQIEATEAPRVEAEGGDQSKKKAPQIRDARG